MTSSSQGASTSPGLMPVIAGVGQVANKDYDRIVHPVDLIEAAARQALGDAGIAPDRVGGVLATPLSTYSTADSSQLLAARLGLAPGLRFVSGYSGASPQRLIAQACQAILEGTADAILVVGGIADASVRRARRQGIEPPAPPTSRWSQGTSVTAPAEGEHGAHHAAYTRVPEVAAGAGLPSAYFALVESAIGQGLDPAFHRDTIGRLLAPFTAMAARRPDLAWFPSERSAAEIADPAPDNRLVAEPYTKLMCSFPTVDLAAAVLITSAAGQPSDAIRPLTVVSGREATPPSGRPVYHRSEMLERIVEAAREVSGIELDTVALFDLYSCFPAAVRLASTALGLTPEDPRPRSVTGGLPYFGGPGASYSVHGIACLVEELRARPGVIGGAVSLGGMVSDFAMGLYGTSDDPCHLLDLGQSTAAPIETVTTASGSALVEAATILHDRTLGPVEAPVVVRLPNGSRTGATAADPVLPAALSNKTSLVGQQVELTTSDDGRITYVTS